MGDLWVRSSDKTSNERKGKKKKKQKDELNVRLVAGKLKGDETGTAPGETEKPRTDKKRGKRRISKKNENAGESNFGGAFQLKNGGYAWRCSRQLVRQGKGRKKEAVHCTVRS